MRTPVREIEGVMAVMPMADINTDAIIPSVWLRTATADMGKGLFGGYRYDADGRERPDFVLNREPYRHARILLADENFGCGSSREAAVWALAQFGIGCVLAPSFADIFYENAFRNGLVAAIIDRRAYQALRDAARERERGLAASGPVTTPAQAGVSQADGRQSTRRQSDDRQSDNRQSNDRTVNDRNVNDRNVNVRNVNVRNVNDRQSDRPPAAGSLTGSPASNPACAHSAAPVCRVDLASATVTGPDGAVHPFSIPASRAQALMRGDDEIAMTLSHLPAIEAHYERLRTGSAWLYPAALQRSSAP
ncbi:3-isopropylmalate dehydratase small subunit [Bordetella bronchialis]|uniref:3-isopropylmalate dehydratase small subunit n=1 Tax=Bordetella bronchialis TaxID=463025 RepID=UPI003D0229E3